jgi:integrase
LAVEDTWQRKDGTPSARNGRGLRYRVRWRGQAKSFRTKREADTYWLTVRTTKAEPEAPDVTVGELVDQWLATKLGLTPKGYEACTGAAGHVKAKFGDQLAASVTRLQVETWIAAMPGSASLRTKAMQCLSGAMRIGVDEKLVAANPCVEIHRPKQLRHDAHFLTPEQLQSVAAECGGDRKMAMFLGTTGVRVGEAARLDVGDVDRRRKRARVRKSKNGEARDVPVPASVMSLLDLSRPATDPLFVSPTGSRVHINNWRRRVFTPAAARAGVAPLRIHDLRHTAASLAIRSGADVKAVQTMLGHKSAAMTLDVYGHLWDRGLDDVAKRMDGLFE